MLAPHLRKYLLAVKFVLEDNPYSNQKKFRTLAKIYSIQYKESTRLQSTMSEHRTPGNDKIFVQHIVDKKMMRISFEHTINGKSRCYNLLRDQSEPVSSSLSRIKLNLSRGNKRDTKAPSNTDDLDQHSVNLTKDGSLIDINSLTNIDAWVEGAVLNIDGKSYRVSTNSPQVEFLKLPPCMMKGFVIIPSVTLTNCTMDQCKFTWYRIISPRQRHNLSEDERLGLLFDGRKYLYKISNDLTFRPGEDDVAYQIRVDCTPSDGIREGPTTFFESPRPVELGPSHFPFEKRHLLTQNRLESLDELRVLSYNILADLYADSEYSRSVLFGHCPPYALDIEYRKQILLKEITGYNADLLCLQEVDKKEFERTYEPFFRYKENFSGIFDTKGGQVAEGCATFFRNDKFELVDSHKTLLSGLIEPSCYSAVAYDTTEVKADCNRPRKLHPILSEPIESDRCLAKFDKFRLALESNQNLKKRFMDRHTILQTTLLKLKSLSDKYILLANTHLYFAPDADHIRLLQGSICVKYIEYIRDYYMEMLANTRNVKPTISVMLCGDMNSTPDCGLYSLVTTGHVPDDLPDWKSNEEESVSGLSVDTHLRFSSAYKNIAYTNYTMEFNGCLDYIYYDIESLTCTGIVPLPDHEDVTAIGGLPSDVFPSDHLALIADFKHSG